MPDFLNSILRQAIGRIASSALRLPDGGADFEARGFYPGEAKLRARLEFLSEAFRAGFNTGLREREAAATVEALANVDAEVSGFAFEGAAMSLSLLDSMTPGPSRMSQFLKLAAPHIYMIHVGIGCAIARVPWQRGRTEKAVAHLDPLLRSLAIDGYGFHQGFFHPEPFVRRCQTDERLGEPARRMFDQGIGRSIWFVECADVNRIADTVGRFPDKRRPDLWTGIGVACGMAGIIGQPALSALARSAGLHRPNLALGTINAVRQRERASNRAPHTDLACEVFCEMSPGEALATADAALATMAGSRDYLARQARVMEALRAVSSRI